MWHSQHVTALIFEIPRENCIQRQLTASQLLISCHKDEFIPILSRTTIWLSFLQVLVCACVCVCLCSCLCSPKSSYARFSTKQHTRMHYTTTINAKLLGNINSINICQFVWRSLFKCHTIIMINLEGKHLHWTRCRCNVQHTLLSRVSKTSPSRYVCVCVCVQCLHSRINATIDGLSYYIVHCARKLHSQRRFVVCNLRWKWDMNSGIN